MLVRTADWMAEISGAREIALTMVAFRAITENLVQIRVGQNDGPEALGSATFELDGAVQEIGFFDTGQPAPTGSVAPACTYALNEGNAKDRQQSFRIGKIAGLEDLMVAMVQAVKVVHSGLAEDSSDIWFTGLRGARIPTDITLEDGMLTLTRARVMGKAPHWQTLTKVDLGAARLPPMMMSFSFQSATYQPAG